MLSAEEVAALKLAKEHNSSPTPCKPSRRARALHVCVTVGYPVAQRAKTQNPRASKTPVRLPQRPTRKRASKLMAGIGSRHTRGPRVRGRDPRAGQGFPLSGEQG
jgi:hypothetical protein